MRIAEKSVNALSIVWTWGGVSGRVLCQLRHFYRLPANRISCLQTFSAFVVSRCHRTRPSFEGSWFPWAEGVRRARFLIVIHWSNWFLNLTPCVKRLSDGNARPSRPAVPTKPPPALLELTLLLWLTHASPQCLALASCALFCLFFFHKQYKGPSPEFVVAVTWYGSLVDLAAWRGVRWFVFGELRWGFICIWLYKMLYAAELKPGQFKWAFSAGLQLV